MLFQGTTDDEMEQSQSPHPLFPQGFTCWVIRGHALPCKTLLSRPKVGRFCEGVKRVQVDDYSTSKQNASMTVGKSHVLNIMY